MKLLQVFRDRVRRPTPLRKRAARSSYSAYINFLFFVVTGTWLATHWVETPLLEFAILVPLVVLVTSVVAGELRRLPGARRVL